LTQSHGHEQKGNNQPQGVPMVYRKLPQRLGPERARIVFAAVMDCRRAARQASVDVQPGCPVDHALHALVRAIDTLSVYLTRLRREGDLMDYAMGEELHGPSRGNRPSVIDEPGLLLGDLRTCRNTLNSALADVAPLGATSESMQVVSAAIEALAMLLTGDRDYFHGGGSGATNVETEQEARKLARERGELPWRT